MIRLTLLCINFANYPLNSIYISSDFSSTPIARTSSLWNHIKPFDNPDAYKKWRDKSKLWFIAVQIMFFLPVFAICPIFEPRSQLPQTRVLGIILSILPLAQLRMRVLGKYLCVCDSLRALSRRKQNGKKAWDIAENQTEAHVLRGGHLPALRLWNSWGHISLLYHL